MVPFLPGNNENNILIGSVGNDAIQGFGGDDSLYGGLGNDSLVGGFGNDLIADDDGGRDILVGGSGNDYLQVRDQAGDTLFGGAGDDVAYIDRREITTPLSFAFNERTGVGSSFNDGTELYGIERLYLYSGAGNDTGTIVIDPNRGLSDASQIGFGTGTDLLRIDFSQFTLAVTTSGMPFTPGSNARFLVDDREVFSALSVERVEVRGSSSGDVLSGFSLSDTLHGNDGHDVLSGDAGNDRIFGGRGNDILIGGAGADRLVGASGNDAIQADAGNDTLSGGSGNDSLIGGAGRDTFIFDTRASRTNIDTIDDFNPLDDTMHLRATAFGGLQAGPLDPIAFASSLSGLATGSSHRILYEIGTGRLYYDSDGVGGAARVHFATVSPGLALTDADFLVY
jgi:Ca2+-binding RTX toxin-like protein